MLNVKVLIVTRSQLKKGGTFACVLLSFQNGEADNDGLPLAECLDDRRDLKDVVFFFRKEGCCLLQAASKFFVQKLI